MTDPKPEPRIGDWIRFLSGGRVVIGEVLYRDERAYAPWEKYSITDIGEASDSSVLETRMKYNEPRS